MIVKTQLAQLRQDIWHTVGTAFSCRGLAAFVITLSAALAGCGASHEYARTALTRSPPEEPLRSGRLAPSGIHTLARVKLQDGGRLAIVVERYKYQGRVYANLAHYAEPAHKANRYGAGGGGPALQPAKPGIVDVNVSYGCSGSHAYVLAYGLLRERSDSITAIGHGVMIRLHKVAIPASFHYRGVLVYALLQSGAVRVITRTSRGEIVSSGNYTGKSAICDRR